MIEKLPLARYADGTLGTLRLALLGILTVGLIGTLVDLILLEHIDGFWQLLPLALLGAGIVLVAWHAARPARSNVRALRLTMLLLLVTGAAGVVLHVKGNLEFELEMHATNAGLPLFWEVIRGATPALAPGTLVQLGLIGLAYCWRHPALARAAMPPTQSGFGRKNNNS